MSRHSGRYSPGFQAASLLLLVLVGCVAKTTVVPVVAAPVESPPAVEVPFKPPSPLGPIFAPGQVRELVPGGAIDWSGKTVRARGAGVLDPGNSNRDLARQMAERAGAVVAQRSLFEIVKGIRVDSDTRVQDLMAARDSVYQRVEAVVKNARLHGPARYDSIAGIVEVEMECDLYGEGGVEGALLPSPVAGPPTGDLTGGDLSNDAREFLRQYSAVVLDAGSTGLKPSLFPKLYDDNGVLLLDPRDLAYADATRACAVQYVRALDQVQARPDFGQPLVLKVREARGRLGTDIVLARGDAAQLERAEDGLPFLIGRGRVLIELEM
jgi:hypothetical protein